MNDEKTAAEVARLRRTILWLVLGIPGIIMGLFLLWALLSQLAAGPTPVLFG